MLNTTFSPWPSYTEEEAQAVQRVLLSNKVNYWTGHECREFEREFASWCGTKHAIALANGTLALDLALKGLGVGPGDEVVVTPRTFIASVSCVVNAGATPVFADVEAHSGNLSARTIAQVLTARTKAIVCVHLAGWPCDMDPIMRLAEQHSLKVIEDCAQAHGALYRGRSVGSIGHVGAWSFCQDKIMTTGGEGGMVTVNDEGLWRDMWAYKDHGKSYAAVYERQHPPGFRWLHDSFGTNWRMLEVQAAIGRIQLRRLPEWTRQRNAHANALIDALSQFADPHGPVRLPTLGACTACPTLNCPDTHATCGCLHAQYKFYVYVQKQKLAPGWSRDRIVSTINEAGVPCYHGSCSEVYLEKAFDSGGRRPTKPMPTARDLGESSLMFLVHPTLTTAEIQRTAFVATQVLSQARFNRN
ncbi:DegT/DnrJ/EryC1/StrS aminotransferase family protein [Acidovorax sp.]|uniref:DegT/DnrJ/EryC1/StrS family aminotransferase n=1 Tax=Acidovorax sp. TaxID=1872122 RepID=UPI0025BFB8A0|nr:DegT/DnrJ/EryC1/StrS aminotransferase family protein [Acidovorax sp.]